MVTYLKTLIYIQDTSCAGLRVWPAVLDIFADFKFLFVSRVRFVRLVYLGAVLGEEAHEEEGGGEGGEAQSVLLSGLWGHSIRTKRRRAAHGAQWWSAHLVCGRAWVPSPVLPTRKCKGQCGLNIGPGRGKCPSCLISDMSLPLTILTAMVRERPEKGERE